ncbi:EF-P beta-lysylation protein EpmB [Rhodanobacter sp. FW510-R12]|uniref:EF-P beta-lysylation protein EpmB n=1 Tax=unclassified Rhodanobacter TaxID=2621553 RepID=UPI0007AA0F4D|nr:MULTISPECIES: EF-P beta-lysylation protein EpmB [unclassified Rhodanobacter]KZC16419.1 EF-P beta-lysylation protein EpmB [Rhodanobacter sp. FW104-R8]KZC25373.1 EF-P beta-lysylation protein EpmB [Rhodanobacter sp. FW510-T8]KZC31433.1 EF-P beta-lysylation protein EpmB [Rhodanobacter sp. FW510-R10]
MITASPGARITPDAAAAGADWRQLWRDAVTDAGELLALLGLSHLAGQLPPADAGFQLRVPRGFVARMRQGDPRDPLLLQVLPQLDELDEVPGFVADAVGDLAAREAQGVLHKYQGRALLIASGSCAINCRYCFRRHFPYGEEMAAAGQWRQALEYLRRDRSISELILSGGDPLALATGKLEELGHGLAGLPHVTRLRIHSRLPVVLPERIDDAFVAWLAGLPLQKVVVLHANHANELDASVDAACARLRAAGATVLNQSVLLRGVNDDADTLAALSERLFAAGVLPYYLHQLDRVQGAAHFEVDDDRALALTEALRARLPGYLVPRLVREVGGDASKRPL